MKKINRSLNIRITGLILATISLILFFVWLVNNLLLESVYLDKKVHMMENAFSDIDKASGSGRLYKEEYAYTLEKVCSNENLSVMVISSDGTVMVTSQNENTSMFGQFFDVMLERSENPVDVIESGDDYTISRQVEGKTQSEFLTLWGTLSDGNLILIRTSVQSVADAAKTSNRLLLYIGAVSFVLGLILTIIITSIISRLENDIMVRDRNEKMRREFISNVSHELKTPLALIKGYAEGLSDGICDEDEREFYLDVILDETDKMSSMVSQLLSLNRLEYGQSVVNKCDFDIVATISGVLNAHQIMLDENDIFVDFTAEKNVMIYSDPGLCEQVVDNYLSNAIHYVDDNKYISIKLIEKPHAIRFEVFNKGDLIPQTSLDSVWEKFYKVDEARTREYGGTGIGLSIVKAISESLDNECGVENRGDGVNFWFDFDKKY